MLVTGVLLVSIAAAWQEVEEPPRETTPSVAVSSQDSDEASKESGVAPSEGDEPLSEEPPEIPPRYASRYSRDGEPAAMTKSIAAGLDWLVRHQSPDGRWDSDGFMDQCQGIGKCTDPGRGTHDVGATGLAILALLGAGVSPSHGAPEHRAAVQRGLDFLCTTQTEDGLLARAGMQFTYDHAIGAHALIEGAGLWNRVYAERAQKAVDRIVAGQAPSGGWQYGLPSMQSDSSVTAWMIQTVGTAKDLGLSVDERAFRGALQWFDSATHPRTGRIGYHGQGGPPARDSSLEKSFPPELSESLTAAGNYARLWILGSGDLPPAAELGLRLIESRPPEWDAEAGTIDMYYWYWGSQLLARLGGERWSAWRKALISEVVGQQQTLGDKRGSWTPAGAWGHIGGRVYSTALLLLTLEAEHRYVELSGTGISAAAMAEKALAATGAAAGSTMASPLSMNEVRAAVRYGDEEAGLFLPVPFVRGAPSELESPGDTEVRLHRYELPELGRLEIGCLEGDADAVATRLIEGRPKEWVQADPTPILIAGQPAQRYTMQGDPMRQVLCFGAFGRGHWIAIDHGSAERENARRLLDWIIERTALFDPGRLEEIKAEGLEMLHRARRERSIEDLKQIASELQAFGYDPTIVRDIGRGLDERGAVRVATLEALSGFPGRTTANLLERAFRERRASGEAKRAILDALTRVDPETAMDLALSSLNDRQAALVQRAIDILAANPTDPTKIRRELSKASARLKSAARRDPRAREVWLSVSDSFERAIEKLSKN